MSRTPDTGRDALLSVVAGGGAATGFLPAAATGFLPAFATGLLPASVTGLLPASVTGCSWVMVVINDSFRGRRWPEFGHVKMSSWRGTGNARPRGRMISAGKAF